MIVIATIPLKSNLWLNKNCVTRRCWRSYSEDTVKSAFSAIGFGSLNTIGSEIGVQQHWNLLENCLINVIDRIAPLVEVELGKRYNGKIVPNITIIFIL